jgi:uncharacterized membrane protein YdjX (TVP38/TMEM64 family)
VHRRRRLAAGLLVLAVLAAGALVSPAVALSALEWLAADPVRFALALVGVACVRFLLVWPTTLLAVAAGYALGVAGVPLALACIVVSALPTYLLARRVGGEGRASRAAARVRAATGDVRGVTATRLLPIPSDVVSAGAGVAAVGPGAFVAGTALGELPWAVAGVLAGSTLESLAGAGTLAVVDLRLVLAAGAVGVALLAGPAARAATDAGTRGTRSGSGAGDGSGTGARTGADVDVEADADAGTGAEAPSRADG